jgi:hypothetical protein
VFLVLGLQALGSTTFVYGDKTIRSRFRARVTSEFHN